MDAVGVGHLHLRVEADGEREAVALDAQQAVLGPQHPNTATSLNNLGMLLQDLNDLDGARPYLERALVICEQVLGPQQQVGHSYFMVPDLDAARAELIGRGVEASEMFHFEPTGRTPGPDPDRENYNSFLSFSDPDGNGWLVQEVDRTKATA